MDSVTGQRFSTREVVPATQLHTECGALSNYGRREANRDNKHWADDEL